MKVPLELNEGFVAGEVAGDKIKRYYSSNTALTGFGFLLIFLQIYKSFYVNDQAYAVFRHAMLFLSMLLSLSLIAKASKYVTYGLMLAVLLLNIASYTLKISDDPAIDRLADRDEMVEIAARGLLDGKNPWTLSTQLGTGFTIGPASVLIAIPAVLFFGKINILSFAFYILLTCYLLYNDYINENQTFIIAGLIMLNGSFFLQNSMFFSLDEHFFPVLYFVAAYELCRRNRSFGAGLVLSLTYLSRLSWTLPLLTFLMFYGVQWKSDVRRVRLLSGLLIGSVIILFPFLVIVGPSSLAANNSFHTNMYLAGHGGVIDANYLMSYLNHASTVYGINSSYLKALTALGVMVSLMVFAYRYARVQSLFLYLGFSSLLSFTVIHCPLQSADYALAIVLPGIIHISQCCNINVHKEYA